jgi:peptidoglycan/LPS O-acetylase OafA/YrhL
VLHGALVLTSLQSWWPPAALAWNPPGWSLSVEWFLYAMFPLLMLAVRRVPPGLLIARVFALVACVSAFRVLVMAPLVEEDADAWYSFAQFFPIFHLPQFLFGVALAQLHRLGPRPSPGVASWMFAGGIIGLMVLFATLDDAPGWLRSDAVLVAFFGLLILGAAQEGHIAHRVLSARPLVFLGNVSFAVYALHQPLATWWETLVGTAAGKPLLDLIEFPLYTAFVLAFSALCYRFIETPLRRRIRRWGAPRPQNTGS